MNKEFKRLTHKHERQAARREIPVMLTEPERDQLHELRDTDDFCMDRYCPVCYGECRTELVIN